MSLDRKTFLYRAAVGAAGFIAGATARAGNSLDLAARPVFDPQRPEPFWRAVREQYPLSRALGYFNTGGLGPASQPVLAAAAETIRRLQETSEHGHSSFEAARVTLAGFLGAEPAEIAFVRNATEGNGIVAAGLKLAPGDEVIFESHAHPGGSFPWLNQQALRGVVVRVFVPDPRDPEENVLRIKNLMTRRTRVVQVSHVTAPTGIVMPVRAIANLCRERGAWFHVDAAQSAGMFPFSVREIGCDSLATSGHKWLGGPLETGVLFVRQERLDEVVPVLVGAYSGDIARLPGDLRLSPTAERYEYGTRNPAAAVGLAEAVQFQERIGRERIAARGRELAARVRAGLAGLRGTEIITPDAPELCASMITFKVEAVRFDRLFERLMKEHALRCRPVSEENLDAVRVSTHLFNSPAECDALIEAVDTILRSA